MDENAIHQWLIDCFGQMQGEMAWSQIQALPESVRDQLFGADASQLPKPAEVQGFMQAFASEGMPAFTDMQNGNDIGPINIDLAKSIAKTQAEDESSERVVNAQDGQAVREAMSAANLWLDSACQFDPAPGEPKVLTRANWVNDTLDSWAAFASPVAKSTNDALASVLSERFGDAEISGIFAGPVPISLPEGMKDPASIIKFMGNTAFSMQLGRSAGSLSHEVHGSFDQNLALGNDAAGGLVAQNCLDYAKSLEMDRTEVLEFLALEEVSRARLFANVPWLMPRFEALIGKYARGVSIDLDAMEEQLREATSMDPESISGALDMSKVAIDDTPEQIEAVQALEELLAMVEGWVNCVTWQAGMAHIPHIEQLQEMARRERAVGGPAERTFESLIGLELKPKRVREATDLWKSIGQSEGLEARDAKWSHPDLLPQLPDQADKAVKAGTDTDQRSKGTDTAKSKDTGKSGGIDWDKELSKLLAEEGGDGDSPDQTKSSDENKPDEDHEDGSDTAGDGDKA